MTATCAATVNLTEQPCPDASVFNRPHHVIEPQAAKHHVVAVVLVCRGDVVVVNGVLAHDRQRQREIRVVLQRSQVLLERARMLVLPHLAEVPQRARFVNHVLHDRGGRHHRNFRRLQRYPLHVLFAFHRGLLLQHRQADVRHVDVVAPQVPQPKKQNRLVVARTHQSLLREHDRRHRVLQLGDDHREDEHVDADPAELLGAREEEEPQVGPLRVPVVRKKLPVPHRDHVRHREDQRRFPLGRVPVLQRRRVQDPVHEREREKREREAAEAVEGENVEQHLAPGAVEKEKVPRIRNRNVALAGIDQRAALLPHADKVSAATSTGRRTPVGI
mmetsp:Transcript_10628/g.25976  ORF Transcript_10628/g.25976 Transcript_10628/m.25976 type:complete len:331 (-) Transcript_10628:621-1613(-)